MADRTVETPCGQCGMPRLPHQLARDRGEIGHDWQAPASPAVEKLRDKVAAQVEQQLERPQVFITVVPTPDLTLRRFLVEKGILSEHDLLDLKARDVSPQLPTDIL